MGRDLASHEPLLQNVSFDPRARMGRDDYHWQADACYDVSIHAPAWGATGAAHRIDAFEEVSIHAPAWGATSAEQSECARFDCFDPRARMGRD